MHCRLFYHCFFFSLHTEHQKWVCENENKFIKRKVTSRDRHGAHTSHHTFLQHTSPYTPCNLDANIFFAPKRKYSFVLFFIPFQKRSSSATTKIFCFACKACGNFPRPQECSYQWNAEAADEKI